jgi:hypothetical protein
MEPVGAPSQEQTSETLDMKERATLKRHGVSFEDDEDEEVYTPSTSFSQTVSTPTQQSNQLDKDLSSFPPPSSAPQQPTPKDIEIRAPETKDFAVNYVTQWLNSAKRATSLPNKSLPDLWTGQGLRNWLLEQHDLHGQTFEDNSGNSLPTKTGVINSTLQLAPLILIDGSWLQGFTDICLASSSFGYLLFEIYWDELGNGQIDLNHPKRYRYVISNLSRPFGARSYM